MGSIVTSDLVIKTIVSHFRGKKGSFYNDEWTGKTVTHRRPGRQMWHGNSALSCVTFDCCRFSREECSPKLYWEKASSGADLLGLPMSYESVPWKQEQLKIILERISYWKWCVGEETGTAFCRVMGVCCLWRSQRSELPPSKHCFLGSCAWAVHRDTWRGSCVL